MTQMIVFGPFGKLNLGHEVGPEPAALFHRFGRQGHASTRAFRFRQVCKRALFGFQTRKLRKKFASDSRDKAVTDLGDKEQLACSIIPDEKSLEKIGSRNVPTDHELLTPVDSVFDPCAAPLAGLV